MNLFCTLKVFPRKNTRWVTRASNNTNCLSLSENWTWNVLCGLFRAVFWLNAEVVGFFPSTEKVTPKKGFLFQQITLRPPCSATGIGNTLYFSTTSPYYHQLRQFISGKSRQGEITDHVKYWTHKCIRLVSLNISLLADTQLDTRKRSKRNELTTEK